MVQRRQAVLVGDGLLVAGKGTSALGGRPGGEPDGNDRCTDRGKRYQTAPHHPSDITDVSAGVNQRVPAASGSGANHGVET